MTKTILVTVSDDRSGRKGGKYGATQEKIREIFANNKFFDKQLHWKIDHILHSEEFPEISNFYNENKELLDELDPARNGRLYKPFVISQSLKQIEDGDFLVYNDCSPELWEKFEEDVVLDKIYHITTIQNLTTYNNDFLTAFVRWDDKQIFDGEYGKHTHDLFTLETCIDIMKGEHCRHSFQCASGMICIRKTPATVALVDSWLHYNKIKECSCMNVDETEESYYSRKPGRKLGNRHDQSVLSMILNQQNYNYVDILYNDLNPYNFLNFCRRDTIYNFINSNKP